jgi:transcriptional regulator with XRE-family HTH domain
MGRGKHSERKRRLRLALQLRTEGLSLEEIGRRLGCSGQAVWQLLGNYGREPVPYGLIRCCHCDREIVRGRRTLRNNGPVSCLGCLERRRVTRFGERLKAFRVAAGLSQREVTERTGLSRHAVLELERTGRGPAWATLLKLVRVFGAELLTLGIVDRPAR